MTCLASTMTATAEADRSVGWFSFETKNVKPKTNWKGIQPKRSGNFMENYDNCNHSHYSIPIYLNRVR